jgi:hypothetical protein
MASTKYQPITLRPLTGAMDLRSPIDETPPGAWRWKLNLAINPNGSLARAMGWVRYGSGVCPKNFDFHNQGMPAASREPFTFMWQSTANDGTRRLFVGTKTRLFYLNEVAGTYVEIGSGFGADGSLSLTQTRFNSSELQNKVVFTNDFDLVQIHTLGTGVVAPIPSLANSSEEGGPITRAKRTVSWNGVVFLLNTVEDGEDHPSRIRWSDFNDATWWNVLDNPNTGSASIADYQDLDYGEEILNAIPLGGALMVFTDRSIWRCSFAVDVGGNQATLSCVKVYTEPRNRAKCLAYPNTLVSTGASLYYAGSDAIYEYNQFLNEPDRVEWIYRATTIVFSNPGTLIDKRACASPIMEYVPGVNEDATAGGEIHFSWPTYDPAAEPVDPDGEIDCTEPIPPPIEGSGVNNHTLVINTRHRTCDYRDYGSTAMVNFTPDISLSGECDQQAQFLNANGADQTIKKMNSAYFREMYDPVADEHFQVGYYSQGRMVFPFDRFDVNKLIRSFMVELSALNPNDTAVVQLRIGTSDRALDPNGDPDTGKCQVLWHQMSRKPIKCSYLKTAEQYVADNVRPDESPFRWHFQWSGRFLYLELTLMAADGAAPKTAGCAWSRLEVEAKVR